ncbi:MULTISPECIES: hypothetical protein [Cupriavidus]
MATQTGNGRCQNKQCTRHHRSDDETTNTSSIVAARAGTGRSKQNHRPHHETTNNKKPRSALPLPARQSAFLAYFLFGQKKVGRAGGAKAFDFEVDFDFEVAFDSEVAFIFEFKDSDFNVEVTSDFKVTPIHKKPCARPS